MNSLIERIETEYMKENVPFFHSGDIVEVRIWVVEGSKRRIQSFEGVVIAIRRGQSFRSAFTVRKVSNSEGIERVFQIHSPIIEKIIVKRSSAVRKSKLYYLRRRSGKSARLKEKIN